MRVVPRIIINIRPGMQRCVPGLFFARRISSLLMHGNYVIETRERNE